MPAHEAAGINKDLDRIVRALTGLGVVSPEPGGFLYRWSMVATYTRRYGQDCLA
jgi:hypothetical protein